LGHQPRRPFSRRARPVAGHSTTTARMIR
jgi:hypothetical protein